MKTRFTPPLGNPKVFRIVVLIFLLPVSLLSFGQTSSKSLLINHGSVCGSNTAEQNFLTGSTSLNPQMIGTSNAGLPFYSVLTAYNPEDHKVYYANMTATNTYVYAVDYNLDGAMTSPTISAPTYTYNYPLNQLCFDNYGDNYVFAKFNKSTGTVTLNRIDITTGNEIPGSNKQVTFPSDNIPNTLLDGDIVVLPNGRMFVTFGNAPSKLYEIINSDGPGKANAVLLANIPRVCFSIAYTDGNLMIAGSDGSGCYYYTWDINSFALSTGRAYPLSKSSADMSSMTIGVGVANRLQGANVFGGTNAVMYYEIVLKNKGNANLNNLQLTNNLAQTFGAAAISDVQLQFVSNPANMMLNPNYNGVSDTNLLLPGQVLKNFPLQQDSLVLRLQFTASNLIVGQLYKNSVLASGQTGAGNNLITVTDSSNNGNWSRIDIDRNGISDDPGENIPTPYVFGSVLALPQLELKGTKNENAVLLNLESSIDADVTGYEVQRSSGGEPFKPIAFVSKNNKQLYAFRDDLTRVQQGSVHYRVKALKSDRSSIHSNIVSFKREAIYTSTVSVLRNPYQGELKVQAYATVKAKADIRLYDILGRLMLKTSCSMEAGNTIISITGSDKIKPGVYWLRINLGSKQITSKVCKQ